MVNTIWEKKYLKDIGTFQKGSGISRDESHSGNLPAVRYGELYTTHNDYIKNYTSHISEEVASKATRVKYGDILFAGSGETKEDIGKCASIIDHFEVYAGGDIVVMTPNIQTHPVFLGSVLNAPYVTAQRSKLAQGDAIVHISSDSLSKTYIYLPSYEEQCRIADALLDIDGITHSLEMLIEKKKNIKHGAMQELLTGKRRLPGFEGEWENMVIGKSGSLLKGSINPQLTPDDFFSEYSMPAFDDGRHPSKVQGRTMHSNRTVIHGRVLLFNKLNVRQKRIWLVEDCGDNAVCSGEFLPYCSDKINLKLLSQILYTDEVTTDFIGMSTGTSNSQKRITPKTFLDYSLFLPTDPAEQEALAVIFNDMDNEVRELQEQVEKYKQVKQGMMQKLLTGEIRLG